jgi:hypothetical protein
MLEQVKARLEAEGITLSDSEAKIVDELIGAIKDKINSGIPASSIRCCLMQLKIATALESICKEAENA